MLWRLYQVVLCVTALALVAHGATVTSTAGQSVERNLFAADIYNAIATEKLSDNVVISPAAIQTSMALAYFGAKGKTATEMQSGLRLGSSNADEVMRRFGEFQQTFTRNNNVRLVNNIYINENLEFRNDFKQVALRNFDTNVDTADFHPPYNKRTADSINQAIETKTNGKVKNVLQAQQLNDFTEGIIVNGIAYSAPWQKAFRADKTTKRSFSSDGRITFDVDTMWTLNNFNYGEFSDLDAKVIELPYQISDFSMLVILPNKKNGLNDLIKRLANKNLLGLIERGLSSQKVEVYLPKFSVTFGVSLEEPFKKLGVTTMFTRSGDFGNLYRMFVSHFINSVNHKAYVEVTESGAEAPLESGGLKNLFSRKKSFDANHPFVFAIRSGDSILFMGHVANYVYA